MCPCFPLRPQPPRPVCILGGSSEIGLALGHALQARNWPCIFTVRSEEGYQRVFQQFPQASTVYLNASDPNRHGSEDVDSSPESLPARCAALLGSPPAYLVDCLHSRFEKLFIAASPREIDNWALADIAVRARLLRAFSQTMLSMRFGRCIFISSTAAHAAATGQSFYTAAKLAGEALYRSVGLELGKRGVSAVSLRLGWLEAGRGADWLAQHDCRKHIPQGRYVRMDEVVDTLLWLLVSPALTSTTITLDGGMSSCKV